MIVSVCIGGTLRLRLSANANMSDGTEKPKHVQKPYNYHDYNDCVQDRLNRPLHRYEAVDQPKENAHNNQNGHYL
jgi:hypothetical protein